MPKDNTTEGLQQFEISGGLAEEGIYVFRKGKFLRAKLENKPGDGVPRPDLSAFKTGGNDVDHLLTQPQPLFRITKVDYPETGGIQIHLQGMNGVPLKYPAKGYPFPEACQANNIVKRNFIGKIRYLAKHPISALPLLRAKGLSDWLDELGSQANITLSPYYLRDHLYQDSCKEIRKFVAKFLEELGVNGESSVNTAEAVCFMFEYDNAYLFRLKDLLNDTSKEAILKNPRKEFKGILKRLKERDSRMAMFERFNSALYLISLALYIPRFRRAFYKAMDEIDFKYLQMDDGDRYHVLRWIGYDFLGMTHEERIQKWFDIHDGNIPSAIVAKTEQKQ